MKIKTVLIKIATGIGAILAATYYVLFKSKKDLNREEELKRLEKEVQEQKKINEEAGVNLSAQQEAQLAEIEEKKKNEEIKIKVASGNTLKQHNDLLDGLRK